MADNTWLVDINYIRELDFPDIYYFETICYALSSFLKNVPVPIRASYRDRKFILAIGSDIREFDISTDISYFDTITLIKFWTENFYPKYEIYETLEVDLSEEEIMRKVQEGVSINDALLMTKSVKKKQKGIIEKVFIKEDQFLLNREGFREVRMSGTIESPMPISVFMKHLRTFKNEKLEDKNSHIYSFIKDNSYVVKEIGTTLKEVLISYAGKQMYNFFVINYPLLKDKQFTKLDDFTYLWGNFKIKFESPTLKSDCINYYENMKEKDR